MLLTSSSCGCRNHGQKEVVRAPTGPALQLTSSKTHLEGFMPLQCPASLGPRRDLGPFCLLSCPRVCPGSSEMTTGCIHSTRLQIPRSTLGVDLSKVFKAVLPEHRSGSDHSFSLALKTWPLEIDGRGALGVCGMPLVFSRS